VLEAGNNYRTKMSLCSYHIALAESQNYVINTANPRGALDNGIEDRLHIGGWTADDAEHLGSRRLMLQGFTQFRVALLDFLKQSYILDGDNGLVGEGLQKGNLSFWKRTNFLSTNVNNTYWRAFAEQRRG
jgi:hypothetical protein